MLKKHLLPKATKIALLQSKFHRVTKHRMSALLKQFELRTVEWIILGYLEHKARLVPYSELSSSLGIQESFLTVNIAKLSERALVETQTDDVDRRKKTARITKDGRSLLRKIDALFVNDFSPYLSGLSAKDLSHFLSVIQKIIKNSEKA